MDAKVQKSLDFLIERRGPLRPCAHKQRKDGTPLALKPRLPLTLLRANKPCVFLGEPIKNQSCGCGSKFRECALHNTCTTETEKPPHKCCSTCGDYRTVDDGDEARRHLLYYVFPVKGSSWEWNLQRIRSYFPLFNGRRCVAIGTDSPNPKYALESAERVRDLLKGECDIITSPQKRKLGEVTAFKTLLSRVQNYRTKKDYTFYAHAKGVTKGCLGMPGTPINTWTDLMYKANLDSWDDVAKDLEHHCCTGAFKREGPFLGPWHYSGTFFWFRNHDTFQRNWANIRQTYGGVEMWPGSIFTLAEAGCTFYESTNKPLLYDAQECARAEHEYNARKQTMSHDITVIIPTIAPRKDKLLRALKSVMLQTLPATRIIVQPDLRHEGAAATRNHAIKDVKTEWIAFLDDDDEFLPDHLEKLVKEQIRTGADVVYPLPRVVNGSGGLVERDFSWGGGPTFDKEHCLKHACIQTTSLVRTAAAQAVGGFEFMVDSTGRLKFDDYGFYKKLILAGYVFAHVHEETFIWHHDGCNTSGRAEKW